MVSAQDTVREIRSCLELLVYTVVLSALPRRDSNVKTLSYLLSRNARMLFVSLYLSTFTGARPNGKLSRVLFLSLKDMSDINEPFYISRD